MAERSDLMGHQTQVKELLRIEKIVNELKDYWIQVAPCDNGKEIEAEDCMACPYLHECEKFD
jgi:hypothetical protein